MTKSKKLSKLVALTVLLGGVTCSSNVWAESVTITIDGTTPTAYSTDAHYGIYNNSVTGDTTVAKIETKSGGIAFDENVAGIKIDQETRTVDFAGTGSSISIHDTVDSNTPADGIVLAGASGAGLTVNNLEKIDVTSVQRAGGITCGALWQADTALSNSVINFTGAGSIKVKSTGGDEDGDYACAIDLYSISNSPKIQFNNVGDIETTAGFGAYGYCAEYCTGTPIGEVNFKSGSVITVKGDYVSMGVYLSSGINYVGTKGNELTGIKAGFDNDGISEGVSFGIGVSAGDNTIAFSGANSFIESKSSKALAYGIAFGSVFDGEYYVGTGKTTITGLGKITAESTSQYDSVHACGIYVMNGNEVSDGTTFTVSFDNTNGGTVNAYSVAGGNYGVYFASQNEEGVEYATGISEIKNVNKIVAGVDPDNSSKISSGSAYGITAEAGVNKVTFTGADRSITVKSSGDSVFGISYGRHNTSSSVSATGTTTITGLGKITAETKGEASSASGIYVRNGNEPGEAADPATFSVAFDETKGGSISAYSEEGMNFGILFHSGNVGTSEVLNVNKITAGVKSGSADSSGKAYGVYAMAGENKVTFTGSDRSITAKSSGNSVFGISYGKQDDSSPAAATGTTTITGLGSIVAETSANEQFDASGIYVRNGNAASAAPTFSVTMNNGSISAYSAQGNNRGISFSSGCRGTSEILNVDKIVAGVKSDNSDIIGTGKAYGICVVAGVNKVIFTGDDSSITAKSNSVAYGVYVLHGTNTVTFTGADSSITAKSSGNSAFGISYGKYDTVSPVAATGTTTISGLGSITAETSGEAKSASGIYVKNGNADDKKFSVVMNKGNISAYSKEGNNYGISFSSGCTGTSEVLNVNKITAGVKSGSADSSGNAYGIYAMAGENKVTFTGDDSSITAKSSGEKVAGICFGIIPTPDALGAAATGTTAISGIGSITAETTYDTDNAKGAFGIYVRNGNAASAVPTFSVSMNNGSISAYSAKGNSNGIAFGLRSTGTSEILNVNKITVGEKEGTVSQSTSYGIYATAGVNKVTFTGDNSSITAKSNSGAYGVYVGAGTNMVTFAGADSSITAKSSGDSVYGISYGRHNTSSSVSATGTTTITGLGRITAETSGEASSASGIYVRNGNEPGEAADPATFSVAFDETKGGSISAYSEEGMNFGILFHSGSVGTSEVLNMNKITAGVKSGSDDSSGKAYGIYIRTGENKVTFAGSDRSITAKSSGNSVFGISYGRLDISSPVAATGTAAITGLSSINVETSGSQPAFGIYVCNGNAASAVPTFSVIMDNGSISAYAAQGNTGIAFGSNSTGTSIVANVNKITVGEKGGSIGQVVSYGIYAMGGENTVTFTGDDKSITAKNSNAAYGVYVGGGTTTISGLKDISVTGSKANSIYVSSGTLILQPSETKSNGSYMTANAPVSMNDGTLEVDFPAACTDGDTILKITAGTGSTFNDVVICGKASGLQVNDEICLIQDNAAITLDDELIVQHSSDGVSWYDAEIYLNETDKTKLMYKKTEKGLEKDGSKAAVEGMAAAAATINTGTDLVLGAGISNLIVSTAGENNTTDTFAAGSYNKSKLKTGSHADISGYGVVVGVGRKVISKNGNKTTGGLFFEYGNNNIDTYNGNFTGDGKAIYKGAGYLMRWDNKSGNYYEGMIHAGKVTTNWNSGKIGGYETDPTYYGAAATYGHKFMIGENKQLSVYGSYIYTHTGSADAKIGNYNYDFEATKSHRTKVGVRYALSDLMDTKKFRPYVGLAWEHEFDGETKATVKGFGSPDSPSMKGDTGILEIGCKQEVGKWTLGIGAEVFMGKRKGWNGTLQAVYNF